MVTSEWQQPLMGSQVNATCCLVYKKTVENADIIERGEGGMKNLENIADIICERFLMFAFAS